MITEPCHILIVTITLQIFDFIQIFENKNMMYYYKSFACMFEIKKIIKLKHFKPHMQNRDLP